MADKKLFLKLLVDTKTNKVLFAEAGKEVVEFLFGLLALPIGTIVKLLSKDRMVGSIGSLYSSLDQIDESYLLSQENKSALLNPPVLSSTPNNNIFLLPLPVTNKKFYRCSQNHHVHVTNIYGMLCPACSHQMTVEMSYVGSAKGNNAKQGGEGELGFVKGVVTYSIMDDLTVAPMSSISSITLLNKFQVKDLGSLKEKNVKLGMEEGLELLKISLQSKHVLSTVFLGKKQAI